jgi:hypothetical protein
MPHQTLTLAAGVRDITPDLPVTLFGYGTRREATRVADSLEINALLLRDSSSAALVFSCDLLFLSHDFCEVLRDRVRTHPNAPRSYDVFCAASHTHFAPAIDRTKPVLGAVSEEYIAAVLEAARGLIDELLSCPGVPVQVHYTTGRAQHAINRRKRAFGRTLLRPNLQGYKDETIHAISFLDTDKRPRALIWNYACHPVAFPDRCAVSADFPGVVRLKLREAVSDSRLPILFLQGFGGNVRPPAIDRSWPRRPKLLALRTLAGPGFGTFSHAEYRSWAGSLAATVSDVFHGPSGPARAGMIRFASQQFDLRELINGSSGDRPVWLRHLWLADDILLVGVSAEVVAEYTPLIQQLHPRARVIPVSCVDWVFGYLPSESVLEEGGYEAGGYFGAFGLEGTFRDDVESVILGKLADFHGPSSSPGPQAPELSDTPSDDPARSVAKVVRPRAAT